MSSFEFPVLQAMIVQPVLVLVAHIPIVMVAVWCFPTLLMAAFRPSTHGRLALSLLDTLRGWSKDAVRGARGVGLPR